MTVKEWLKNEKASMADGIAIYNRLKIHSKHDDYFRNNAKEAPGSLAWNILRQNLQLLVHREAIIGTVVTAPKPKTIITQNIKIKDSVKEESAAKTKKIRYQADDYNKLSINGKELYDENVMLMGQNKSLKASLDAATNDASRKTLADQLCRNEDKIDSNWNRIDAELNGSPLSPHELANKVNAAKAYITRYGKSEKPKQVAKCKEYNDFLIAQNIK